MNETAATQAIQTIANELGVATTEIIGNYSTLALVDGFCMLAFSMFMLAAACFWGWKVYHETNEKENYSYISYGIMTIGIGSACWIFGCGISHIFAPEAYAIKNLMNQIGFMLR